MKMENLRPDGPNLRATIASPTSRDMHWQVKFEVSS
jgi:hypothetical protein